MPPFLLACLAYLSVALPGSTLGLLWPSMRLSFHEPVGALGILLVFGMAASVVSSAATGWMLSRMRVGVVVPLGTALVGLALAEEVLAQTLWVFALGTVLFGLGFGALDSALNAHAAGHFGARDINWMHASYGLGATIGPLLVTGILSGGLTWRWAYGAMSGVQVFVALVLVLGRRSWEKSAAPSPRLPAEADDQIRDSPAARRSERPARLVLGVLAFSAVETGIESGAGIWGYVFLTAGRGLPHEAAGVAVAAYWAMMVVGRTVLGPVAARVGAERVLSGATWGVALGAGLMTVPGSGTLAVGGLMMLGLAAAPIFPLLTLTTAKRLRTADTARTTRMVGLQVATSAVGGAALPAGMGLAIGAFDANIVAPLILALGLTMCGVYGLLARAAGRD